MTNTVKEYGKFYIYIYIYIYIYTKNVTKFQSRNLNVLDENGQLLSEKKKVRDRLQEYFQGQLSDQGQINIEFDMEGVDFNVTNKEISEPTYLEVRCILLKFKHQIAPGIDGKMTDFTESGSNLMGEDTWFN